MSMYQVCDTAEVPLDWQTPNFNACVSMDDWKMFVGPLLQARWREFTDLQKQDLARNFQSIGQAVYLDHCNFIESQER